MRHGTSHFVSRAHACRYYEPQGLTGADIDRKLAEDAIHLGEPPLKAGERLIVIDGRYHIEDGKP